MGIKDFYKEYVYNRRKGDSEDPDRAHYEGVAMSSREGDVERPRELHIDANSVIYSAVSAVYLIGDFGVSKAKYGGSGLVDSNDQQKDIYIKGKIQGKIDELNRSDRQEVENRVLELIYELLVEIMEYFGPLKVATINFDGCAPWAKVMNQRRRRYAYSLTLNDRTTFDTNSISPGTHFMGALMDYLRNKFAEEKLGYTVILSPSSVPGEGEHKIIDRIRTSDSLGPFMIYSPDSDMILLSMLLKPYDVYVCRGVRSDIIAGMAAELELVKPREYWIDTVHVGKLRDAAIGHIGNSKVSIVDFVYTLSLIGNDFLPKQYAYTNVRVGVLNIIKALSVLTRPIVVHNIVSTSGLKEFLGLLYNGYDEEGVVVLGEWKMVENKLAGLPTSYLSQLTLDSPERYDGLWSAYPYKVNGEKYPEEDITSMCMSYITGLTWIINYYTHGSAVSSDWYYPFNYAPLIGHLFSIIEDMELLRDLVKPPVGRIVPTVPHQLLAIMPPASLLEVPSFMRHLWCQKEGQEWNTIPDYIFVDEEELVTKSEIETMENGLSVIVEASPEWHALFIVDIVSCEEVDRVLSGIKVANAGLINALSGSNSSDITYEAMATPSRSSGGRGRGRGRGESRGRGGIRSSPKPTYSPPTQIYGVSRRGRGQKKSGWEG